MDELGLEVDSRRTLGESEKGLQDTTVRSLSRCPRTLFHGVDGSDTCP